MYHVCFPRYSTVPVVLSWQIPSDACSHDLWEPLHQPYNAACYHKGFIASEKASLIGSNDFGLDKREKLCFGKESLQSFGIEYEFNHCANSLRAE